MDMNIKKATHKAYLYGLFFDRTPNGLRPKTLSIDKLNDSSSAAKKLKGKESENEDGLLLFNDGDIKFTADEWVLLKDLLNSVKEATITDAETIEQLKEIFNKE